MSPNFNISNFVYNDSKYAKTVILRYKTVKNRYLSFADSRSFLPSGAKAARVVTPTPLEVEGNEDFDSLLKQARAGIRK